MFYQYIYINLIVKVFVLLCKTKIWWLYMGWSFFGCHKRTTPKPPVQRAVLEFAFSSFDYSVPSSWEEFCALFPFTEASKLQLPILLNISCIAPFCQVTKYIAKFLFYLIFYLQVHIQAFLSLIFMTLYG